MLPRTATNSQRSPPAATCGHQANAGFEPVSNAWDGNQARVSQDPYDFGSLQPISQRRRQDLASLRRPGGQQLQVDIIGVQERAQPQQLHRGRQLARQLLQAEQPSPGYAGGYSSDSRPSSRSLRASAGSRYKSR